MHAVRIPLRQEYLFENERDPGTDGDVAEFCLARVETIWQTGVNNKRLGLRRGCDVIDDMIDYIIGYMTNILPSDFT